MSTLQHLWKTFLLNTKVRCRIHKVVEADSGTPQVAQGYTDMYKMDQCIEVPGFYREGFLGWSCASHVQGRESDPRIKSSGGKDRLQPAHLESVTYVLYFRRTVGTCVGLTPEKVKAATGRPKKKKTKEKRKNNILHVKSALSPSGKARNVSYAKVEVGSHLKHCTKIQTGTKQDGSNEGQVETKIHSISLYSIERVFVACNLNYSYQFQS